MWALWDSNQFWEGLWGWGVISYTVPAHGGGVLKQVRSKLDPHLCRAVGGSSKLQWAPWIVERSLEEPEAKRFGSEVSLVWGAWVGVGRIHHLPQNLDPHLLVPCRGLEMA